MPIYEYKCQKCGKQFEAFQGITEPELKACKFCKGKVHKLVSLSSFSLKGTGWYVTDYAGKKPQTAKSQKDQTAAGESTPVAESKTAETSQTAAGKKD